MNQLTKIVFGIGVLILSSNLQAQSATPEDAALKKLESKAAKLVEVAKIDEAEKADKVKKILVDWISTMTQWHNENDAQLKTLWADWNKARSVVPKDEYPGEVIAHKIDDAYSSLKPAYQEFSTKLSAEATPEQVDAIKEYWSRSPGNKRTYEAYLEIAPGLTDEQKKVIQDRMLLAREDSMLTDADDEIVKIYKRHKVKVEAYIGSLEWAKLHKAFANKGKETNPTTKPAGSGS